MLPYRITEIRPKTGVHTDVHHSMQNRACQIISLDIGKRGWLLVDVGDTEFGPHRICISFIISIENIRAGELQIETENTFYHLTLEKTYDHQKCYPLQHLWR